MKKILFTFTCLFLFAFAVSAKTEITFEEFKFSKDFGMTDIAYENLKGGSRFIALGDEYNCNDNSSKKCNVYYVESDGKVSNANLYYDNEYGDFPGYAFYTLVKQNVQGSTFNLAVDYISNTFVNYKGEDGGETTPEVIKDDNNQPVVFNYVYCFDSKTYNNSACEVGIKVDDNTTKYGIIDGSGEVIVTPSVNNSLVFSSMEERPDYLALQDNSKYYIVSFDGKLETINKSFLDGLGIPLSDCGLIKTTKDANYYSYYGTPCPEGMECAQVMSQTIFVKDKVIKKTNSSSEYYSVQVINDKPYFVETQFLNQAGKGDDDSISTIEGKEISGLKEIIAPTYGERFLSYTKDKKFYVVDPEDMTNKIVDGAAIREDADALSLLASGRSIALTKGMAYTFLYRDFAYILPGSSTWEPKYYLLTVIETEEETPQPKPEEEKKYSCQKVDSYFYDKNGNKVNKTDYENSCPETVPDTGVVLPVLSTIVLSGGFILIKRRGVLNKI